MDNLFTKLEDASYAGDVNSLKEILKQDKLLLGKLIGSTSVRDNPLHIAAMTGHADFAREVLSCKPELAMELNSQGLSPLHLAAAHGHVTVVMELLKAAGLNICLLSEKQEGLLPLHVAVKKRRSVVVKVLVEACEEAMHRVTDCGETILHLAIKYNSFDTVEFLIDRVQDRNAKDNRGNTILHHAVASKQLPVIKLLLSKEAINVNTTNLVFLTPLDVLFESRPQNGDLVIGEMIRKAGGKTAAEVLSISELVIRDSVSNGSSNPIPTPGMQPQQPHGLGTKNEIGEITLTSQKDKEEKKYNPQILLLVATLVATITFQAALNPPGGFIPDDKDHPKNKGRPVLASELDLFQVFDLFALFSSVGVMMLLLCVVPRKNKIVIKGLVWVIWVATFSMGIAFIAGTSVLYNYNYMSSNNDKSNDNNKSNDISPSSPVDNHKSNNYPVYFLLGWLILFCLGVSWVLVRFLIFLLKKSGLWSLWNPIQGTFASLKRAGYFVKWQQFSNITKIGSICCKLFKKVICFVLILGVLAGISFDLWIMYMLFEEF